MKAITLTEPWATMVAIGAKRIETRSWFTSYRGPIAIHASNKMTRVDLKTAQTEPFVSLLNQAGYDTNGYTTRVKDVFPETRGKIIAIARLIDCFQFKPGRFGRFACEVYDRPSGRIEITTQEYRLGDFTPGRYGFLITEVRRLDAPIPARGELGLWEWNAPSEIVL